MYIVEVHISQLGEFALSKFIHWCKVENCRRSPYKTEHESFLFYPNLTEEQAQEIWDSEYFIEEE